MIQLEYEMTFRERIEGPLGLTLGSPQRACWAVADASLVGPSVKATLATPGADWVRVDPDGTRRQDHRTQLLTDDGSLILLSYDVGVIQADDAYTQALGAGRETGFGDQYMYMIPRFEVEDPGYFWLTRYLFIGRGRLVGPRQIEYELYRLL